MGIFASKYEKQVILITGASSGIGKACAKALIERGHIVYGAARRVENMQDLVKLGGHAIKMDVMDEKQVVEAVKRIMSEQGKIDVLINNAGYAIYGSVEDITIDEARRQFEVNIFGLARLTKEVLPSMRKVRKGTIINISSVGGKIYLPFGSWYHATKHALEGWSDCLRLELNQFDIKVAIIEPGVIATEIGDVVRQPAIDRSKGSPYEKAVNKFLKNGESAESMSSDPSVIANVVVAASESKNPKRRYVAGAMARPLLFIRSWFGDAVFDYLMLSQLK